jgi:hypothetical protein
MSSSRTYEWLKIEFAFNMSKRVVSLEHIQKQLASFGVGSRKKMYNSELDKEETVWKDDIDKFLNDGYVMGRRPFTDEARKNISRNHNIKSNGKKTQKTRDKMSASQKGKTLSDEHRRLISERRKGMIFSEEHRRHLSLASRGKIYIHDASKKNILIDPKELDYYLAKGWSKGKNS